MEDGVASSHRGPTPPIKTNGKKQKAKPPDRGSAAPSTASYASSSKGKGKSTSNGLRRRKTLDEELRAAAASQTDNHENIYPDLSREVDLDSGILTGVGTRSKNRGFLARGGAGGESVWMGVGYVQGVEEDEEVDNDRGGGHGHQTGRQRSRIGDSDEEDDEDDDEAEDDDEWKPPGGKTTRRGRKR